LIGPSNKSIPKSSTEQIIVKWLIRSEGPLIQLIPHSHFAGYKTSLLDVKRQQPATAINNNKERRTINNKGTAPLNGRARVQLCLEAEKLRFKVPTIGIHVCKSVFVCQNCPKLLFCVSIKKGICLIQ